MAFNDCLLNSVKRELQISYRKHSRPSKSCVILNSSCRLIDSANVGRKVNK